MGCTSSKQARLDRRRSPSPLPRSHSLPGRRNPVVSSTSSTLGSLKLNNADEEEMMKSSNDRPELAAELNKAKAWSEMIETKIPKIPKTPTVTPPNEPETINEWELMEGLEEPAPRRHSNGVDRSFSFHITREPPPKSPKIAGSREEQQESIAADFDPEMLSAFRKALEELSPQHQFLLRSPEPEKPALQRKSKGFEVCNGREIPKFTGIVKARVAAFQEKIDARACLNANAAKVVPAYKCPSGGEEKVVFYFTSLRGVRKTYEDCSTVRVILKGYGVRVDERDVSMHGGFKEELNEILGPGFGGSRLPRVFANGRYIGGAEEVRHMHDAGELGKAFEGCQMAMMGKGGEAGLCGGCGDVRFVPCGTCSGSCKVFIEEMDEDEGDEEQEELGGFRRCPDCNENGLVRCPVCC